MIEFTKSQGKTIATGLTIMALAVVVAFVCFVGWMAAKVLSFVSPAITPVIAGLFLSMFFKPYYDWWLQTVRNPSAAVALMMVSVLVPLAILLWNFGSLVTDQTASLIEQAPGLFSKGVTWFNATFPKISSLFVKLGVSWQDVTDQVYAAFAPGKLAGGLLDCVMSVFSWLIAVIFFLYFLTRPTMSGEDYVKEMPFLKPETKTFVANQINAFLDIVVSFFQRQVIICLIEGCFYGLGFLLVGLPYGFVIGFLLGVLNLVPFLGSVVCLPIALTLAYFGTAGSAEAAGSSLTWVGVLVVWLTVLVLDGYLITPKIQGDKTGLGYAGVIFSFFFWGAVFDSALGLLLAIPLSAFCVVLWRAVKLQYIKPVV